MAEIGGRLKVAILQAKDLKSKDWFSDNDAFVVAEMGNAMPGRTTKCQTEVCHKAKNPRWANEVHYFAVQRAPGGKDIKLNITVSDWDSDGSSDVIGTTVLGLDRIFSMPNEPVNKWFDIFGRKGTRHGKLQMEITWLVDDEGGSGGDAAAAPPMTHLSDLFSFAPPPAPAAYAPPPAPVVYAPPPPPPGHDLNTQGWFYIDPKGARQGPFTGHQVKGWASYFSPTTQICPPGGSWAPLSSFTVLQSASAPPPTPV